MQFAAHRDRLDALDRPRGRVIEIMLAQLTAVVGNTAFRGFKEPVKPDDYMVTKQNKPAEKPKRATRARKRNAAVAWGQFMRAMVANQN